MRPEPPNRIHNPDNRRHLDVGGDAAAIPKKSEPRLHHGVVQDVREERPPIICSAVFSGYRDDPLSRIDLVCQGNRTTWKESRTVPVGLCRDAPGHLGNYIGRGTIDLYTAICFFRLGWPHNHLQGPITSRRARTQRPTRLLVVPWPARGTIYAAVPRIIPMPVIIAGEVIVGDNDWAEGLIAVAGCSASQHLHFAIRGAFEVGGLQIAMNDSLVVRSCQCLGYLSGSRERLIDGNPASGDASASVSPSTSSSTSAFVPPVSSSPYMAAMFGWLRVASTCTSR